jgi:proteasome accessory factor A
MTAIVQDAVRAANARLSDGEELVVYVDNSDRQGNSYGAHLNVTISRRLWEDIFHLRLFPHLSFLASFQASSIVLTGGGKVGSEDGAPPADYQLSRRADFIKTFVAERTTFNRPLINARDEALGGEARLHCIFWDAVLLPAANYLQFGCLQLVTALMEAGGEWMPQDLLLEKPIQALQVWSRDPELAAKAQLVSGAWVTALEHQEMVLDQVERFVSTGSCDESVADAADIAAYWRETLGYLQHEDLDRAARRVEWLAKRRVLEAAIESRGDLGWQSLEIRHLDLSFGDLNVERGVYWALLRNGAIDELVNAADIAHYKRHPPDDTRAQARTTLVRQLGHEHIVSVDWAEVRVRFKGDVYSVHLPNPEQSEVTLNDLSVELIEQAARDFHTLKPYIGN